MQRLPRTQTPWHQNTAYESSGSWTPPPVPPPRRRRIGPMGRGVFAVVTFLTMAYAGGAWWEGLGNETPLMEWLQPSTIWEFVVAGRTYAFWLFTILAFHEFGHYFACRYYRIPATLPLFIPSIPPIGSFGAVIRILGPLPNRKALFDVAAAGPFAGFVVALPVFILGLLRAEPAGPELLDGGGMTFGEPLLLMLVSDWVFADGPLRVGSLFGAGWVGLLVTSLNLFPVGQLDGGHAAYAWSRRIHRTLTWTLALMLALMGSQVIFNAQFPPYVLWFVILLWMRDRHPRLVDEESTLGSTRRLVALLLFLVFLASFIPVPLSV